MASSGSLLTNGWYSSSKGDYVYLEFAWSVTNTSIENNQKTIYWELRGKRSASGYIMSGGFKVVLDGETVYNKSTDYRIELRNGTVVASGYKTLTHNTDGTRSFSVSIQGALYTYAVNCTGGPKTFSLDTIPRASKINSFTGTDLAGNFSVSYTSYSSSFTNKLRISVPNVKALETFNYTSGTSFKLSQTSLDYLYSYTSNTDKVQLGAVIETYNGSTKIGESSELIHYCYVPSDIKPSLGTISLDPVNITTVDGVSRNILVQNKNKINVSVSGCSAGKGSSIKSYTFAVLAGSAVVATNTITSTSTSASTTFGPFSQTGDLKFRVTVKDNRNRSVDNNVSEPTQTCYDYSAPYFSSFTAYRCDANGNEKNDGTHIKYKLGVSYSSTNSTNKSTVNVYYKKSTDSNWTAAKSAFENSTAKSAEAIIKNTSDTNVTFDSSLTYMVYATVKDNYNVSLKSTSVTVFGASKIFNIRPDGSGIAFGKMAESNELLECRWPAKFNDDFSIDGNLMIGSSTQSAAPTSGICVHDVRDAEITPDSFGDKNANFYFDMISNRWYGILHMKGWTGDYASWELAGNAHNSSVDDTLKYRQGRGDTWGDWQTVITDKNIASYANAGNYLPLNGGTLNGGITLPSSQHNTAGSFGLDLSNSDIIGVNGFYFKDSTNLAGEGINFVNSNDSNTYDTLYTSGGILKFHPNRASSAALGGHTIFHSNNFRTGTCTLYTNGSGTTVNFSSAMTGTPTIMLTPLTSTAGALPAKVLSRSASGFTAIIGGDAIAAGTAITFMYLALCG
jgi:hypothetical protein